MSEMNNSKLEFLIDSCTTFNNNLFPKICHHNNLLKFYLIMMFFVFDSLREKENHVSWLCYSDFLRCNLK